MFKKLMLFDSGGHAINRTIQTNEYDGKHDSKLLR